MKKQEIIQAFSDIMYRSKQKTICSFISKDSPESLFSLLENIENKPLSKVQLDQLLILHQQKNISDDFFRYYWLITPTNHFYDVELPVNFKISNENITSIEQLKWGFNRVFIDCIFMFGNIQKGFEILSHMSMEQLEKQYEKFKIDTKQIKCRGKTLAFEEIDKEDRYLISEMACKTLATSKNRNEFIRYVVNSYKKAVEKGIKRPSFKDILEGKYLTKSDAQQMSIFATGETESTELDSIETAKIVATELANRFWSAHQKALINTKLYLSLCNDLDVYVATSMRTKQNFLDMADFCEKVFAQLKRAGITLRYFDPTISAAESHEDKGLIECLMVKSARILIYTTGDRDSYGKDAEAAMALSLGKPTIFYCQKDAKKKKFFKDVHPLSRLVNFQTGVAGGVVACTTDIEVAEILKRIIENKMQYKLMQKPNSFGYYLLQERLTQSIVRVQTNDTLLSTAFWNHYV